MTRPLSLSLALAAAVAAAASVAAAPGQQPHSSDARSRLAQRQREAAQQDPEAPAPSRPAGDATPSPQPSGGQLSGAAQEYPVTFDISDVFSVDWRVDTAEERVFVRLRHEGADDWFAQCWNVNPHMIGGDCLLFQPAKATGGDTKAGVSCVTLSQTSTGARRHAGTPSPHHRCLR